MLSTTKRAITRFISIFALVTVSGVSAVELGNFGDHIFKFQKSMAQRGDTLAQYKLGTLYEFGVSVKADANEARVWYKKAAAKKYTPAINRLTYLEIKKSGFDKTRHASWFEGLQKQVESDDPNALILLGQMSRHGIYVDKNLNKSIVLLKRASSLGFTEVDSEVDEIEREIIVNKERKKQAEQQRLEIEQAEKENKARSVSSKKSKQSKKSANKDTVAETKAAKRLKYEAAMLKLKQERERIEQQQKWAESIQTEE